MKSIVKYIEESISDREKFNKKWNEASKSEKEYHVLDLNLPKKYVSMSGNEIPDVEISRILRSF